jgi:hypothetical protein
MQWALAMIYPEPAILKRAGSSVSKDQTFSAARLSQARTLLREAPEPRAIAALRYGAGFCH